MSQVRVLPGAPTNQREIPVSVYTDLVKIGISDESAGVIAEAVSRPDPVTADYLDKRLAELEAHLLRHINTVLLGMTALFAFFVSVMTAVLALLMMR
jgi:hypothetical protein